MVVSGNTNRAAPVVLGALVATLILIMTLAVVASLAGVATYVFHDAQDALKNQILIIESWRSTTQPEPVERAAYVAAVLVTFPLTLWIVMVVAKRIRFRPKGPAVAVAAIAGALLLSGGFLEFSFIRLIFTGFAGSDVKGLLLPLWAYILGAVVLSAAFLAWSMRSDSRFQKLSVRANRWSNIILAVSVGAVFGALRVRSSDMLYGDVHFEAIFYGVSQVLQGKTLLKDLPSQYGLYAELIGPFMRVTGVTILGFTIFLSAFFLISMMALVAFCAVTIRSVGLRILCCVTLFVYVGSTWLMLWLTGDKIEEYYQLWPIRILFPSLLVFGFVWARKGGFRWFHIIILALFCGVGVIWNLDWGVPAFGALAAYFLVRLIFCDRATFAQNALRLAALALIPALLVSAFVAYLTLKAGGEINWSDSLKYQAVFYATGFGMLPLPRFPHPWMVVIAIYLYGLVHGVARQARRRADFQSDSILVLSVLGIGIFTYYQGRSHDIVLTIVAWPAILIAFMLVDQTLRAVRLGLLPTLVGWSTMPVMVFGILSTFLLLAGLPRLLDIAHTSFSAVNVDPRSPRSVNVAFIRSHTQGKQSAVIIDPGQSILFLESGLASAVRGPGVVEMLLIQDRERMISDLLLSPVTDVFIRADSSGKLPSEYLPLLDAYQILGRSEVDLLFLAPRSGHKN